MTQRKKNPVATRARILESAGEEFCQFGFQAARLNAIVENSSITKGSLFHHFSGKDDLALQWLQETLPVLLQAEWIEPLQGSTDPIETIKHILRERVRKIEAESIRQFNGSPLATLAVSVSPAETALHQAMREIHQSWHRAISDALSTGQKQRQVHSAIQSADEAHLILSLAVGLELHAKTNGVGVLAGFLRSAVAYLDTLRPA